MTGLVIGCGTKHPYGQWDCLDVRPLGCNRYVQDATDLSNIASGSYDRAVSKDLIEHIPWRQAPATLGEWLRVVRDGGVLEIETPNAQALAAMLADPEPEGLYRHHGESDWERFCRTAFGHQDYPANAHMSYFTPAWLADLLLDAGASEVRTVDEDINRFRLEASK